MIALPLTADAVGHVLFNLRDADRRELDATLWRFDSAMLAEAACLARIGFVAHADDLTPVAVVGAHEEWPGVWRVGAFATPRWPEVGRQVTRFVSRLFHVKLAELGAHRLHAYSIADHEIAHRWMLRLGARCEATLQGYGKGGEDFKLFVWRR